MAFGKLLEQKMEERNVKQTELAAAIGIPKSTLSCIISRDNTKIEIELFLKICKFLDCNPEEFYNEYSENEQKQLPPSFVVKYNSLDTHGKLAVDSILNVEYDRCIHEDGMYYRAASSVDNHPAEIVSLSDEERERLAAAHPVTSEDSDL